MAIGLGSLIAFLEEGQNDDWFASVFIQRCFTLAVIFIPLFIICELVSKHPIVNLRLLRIRNLAQCWWYLRHVPFWFHGFFIVSASFLQSD